MPFASPRLLGAREHLARAQFLFDLAREQKDQLARFRLMLSAIYSCRGITEIMLEAAEKGEANGLNRIQLEEEISPKLPFYSLIERIRIHDFHRFGITPPDARIAQVSIGGPIKLTARAGAEAVAASSDGLRILTTGGSSVSLQRPLISRDRNFFDDDCRRFVRLEEILEAFLTKAPDAVAAFEALISCTAVGGSLSEGEESTE